MFFMFCFQISLLKLFNFPESFPNPELSCWMMELQKASNGILHDAAVEGGYDSDTHLHVI